MMNLRPIKSVPFSNHPVFSEMFIIACCLVVKLGRFRVWIRFSVWLVSCYSSASTFSAMSVFGDESRRLMQSYM